MINIDELLEKIKIDISEKEEWDSEVQGDDLDD